MDSSKKYDNPNPRKTANPLSKLIFWWLKPLFTYGKTNDLVTKDLYNILQPDLSEPLGDALEKNWNKELKRANDEDRKPKLFTAIRKTFLWSYIYYGAWKFLDTSLRVLQPYTLGLLINHFAPLSNVTTAEAYMYASGVVIMAIVIALIDHHVNMGQLEMGMRLRIAASSLVYRKILRLSRYSSNETTGGRIVNLLSNDVARFDQVFIFLHYIWIMPIQGAAIAYLIWQNVQVATLAGILLITIQTIPLQGYLSNLTLKLRGKIAVRTDERVRLMSEIITGVQVIKMYTWEKPFQELVSFARKHEIDVLSVISYLRGFHRATFVFTERTTLYFTVMAYVLLGNVISADKVFSMAQYFNRLQCTMAIFFPLAITFASEAAVTINRLENFLILKENHPLAIQQSPIEITSIKMKEVSASWNEGLIVNTLHNINVTIKPGTLTAVVGPVGSGKSSLLQLILAELPAAHGHVAVGGTLSYASQEPWLFAESVRNNILFGEPYDEVRYRQVVKACCLLKDFVQLPQGDKTLVGERGSSLSGGQRARINLARAVYRRVDIYLFDDPLSAVDTHVGKSLFEGCFKEYLANKTRILVTHQVQFLKQVDHIIMLNNGVIEKQGSYQDFQENDFKLMNHHESNEEQKEHVGDGELSPVSEVAYFSGKNDEVDEEPDETEELMAKGKIASSLLWQYFRAGSSYFVLFAFVLFLILGQLGSSGSDYWVAHWTKQEEIKLENPMKHYSPKTNGENGSRLTHDFPFNGNIRSGTESSHLVSNSTFFKYSNQYYDRDTALWIYGVFIAGSVIFTTARNIMFYKICMDSSKNLHNLMFSCLLKAPMRFFDTNPSGRILNRFSKDIGSVDELLPMALIDAIQIFAVMTGILAQVLIINWWTLFPIVIMGYLYWKIKTLYLATAQDIKRLEGITKSPVYSHVNASLAGLATIRSANAQKMLAKEFDSHQNIHTAANSLLISTSTAFGLWLDAVTIVFVAFITYSFIILKNEGTFAGNVGLAISQTLILCGMLQHGMRQTAETVAQMTSVERVLQFTQLDKEGPFESETNYKPPATWPSQGHIKFDHVYLKYSEQDAPVLKDLNIVIEPGMKIGIVGRTGAGKSSLISALFNLATLEGKIYIDKIDTKSIGLHDLRRTISIIPQEPMLFSATLRDNLDPFHQFNDDELWSALEEVELKSSCQSLDHPVSQGGANFSAGQRQLLCLARAITRKNRLLVLDEATANVDPATDALIQRTIRDKFKDCTVLTIAHRLNTVMDSDKILVMDHGQAVEYDHPHVLLQKNDGYLTRMLNETGASITSNLKRIAEETFNQKVENPQDAQEQD
ncbi:multidrug resistance-associated protein 4 [Fopius arisanus]|uniref:Multidrug resistance-associated protein 4 n=1 Tax=Fopius arisanus TaxID=64838 RepID=A0A9R1TPB8_9HYME|nr:PREDICTED: multidrug resistance-associated protein 4-like [Fopius arisanus]